MPGSGKRAPTASSTRAADPRTKRQRAAAAAGADEEVSEVASPRASVRADDHEGAPDRDDDEDDEAMFERGGRRAMRYDPRVVGHMQCVVCCASSRTGAWAATKKGKGEDDARPWGNLCGG